MSIDDEFERTTWVPLGGAAAPAPADAVGDFLVVVEGAEPGRWIEVTDAPLTFGRDAKQAGVTLQDAQVSRLHARVARTAAGVVLENLSATNGTYVDGTRIASPVTLREGASVRMGGQLLRYERRSRQEVERSQALDRDLARARAYVESLLPPPLTEGPVRVESVFVPSMQLGGDAFGYAWIDAETLAIFLLDVSGHGVGAAMHSVAVANVLRQRALPGIDFSNPSDVLAGLNDRFQMDAHDGMLFTMWYGVYRTSDRRLRYSTAGHHPAYLRSPGSVELHPCGVRALVAGAIRGTAYPVDETLVPPGSVLYVFSDGLFEIVSRDQTRWELSMLLPLLVSPNPGARGEADRVYRQVRDAAAPGPLDDDASLLVATFL